MVREIGFQIANDTWNSESIASVADSSALGPLVEILGLLEIKNLPQSKLVELVGRSRTCEAVFQSRTTGSHYFHDAQERSIGIMMCEGRPSPDSSKAQLGIFEPSETCWARWDKFADSLEIAAQSCGLSRRMAQGIAGVVQELQDNIFHHSYRPNSGTLGFRRIGNSIEIVAADLGVGVLASFKKVSAATFESHEEALHAVVYDHRSRFDAKDGHGSGLRQIFSQLATLHGDLRFRTGDVSLSISGNNFTIDHIVMAQEPFLAGFSAHLIISPRGRR